MHQDQVPGTSLFDEDDDSPSPERRMAGPSEDASCLIGQHLAEREAPGRDLYWPDWDD